MPKQEENISLSEKLRKMQEEAEKKRADERQRREKKFLEEREKEKLEERKQTVQAIQECVEQAPGILTTVTNMTPSYHGAVIGNIKISSYEEKELLAPLVADLTEKGLTVFFIRGSNRVYNHLFEQLSNDIKPYQMRENDMNPNQISGYRVEFKIDSAYSSKTVWFASKTPELQVLNDGLLKIVACWK